MGPFLVPRRLIPKSNLFAPRRYRSLSQLHQEYTKTIISKQNAAKPPVTKSADSWAEPCQHAPSDKNNPKNGFMYIFDENNVPILTMVVRGKGWNKWDREADSPNEPTSVVYATQPAPPAGPSRTVDLSKHCKYHDVKGHDTTECKSLYAQFLSSLASGDFKVEPLKAKPKNDKSWSKNKERRAQQKANGKGRQNENQSKDEDKAPKDDGDDDSFADEEQPTNRRRIEVILSQQALSSDEEDDDSTPPEDLRNFLKRKLEHENSSNPIDTDLQLMLNAMKSRRILTSDHVPEQRSNHSITDLQDKLNANTCDLRVLLNRSKSTDLHRQLERPKMHNSSVPLQTTTTHLPTCVPS